MLRVRHGQPFRESLVENRKRQWYLGTFLLSQMTKELAKSYKPGTIEHLRKTDPKILEAALRIEQKIDSAFIMRDEKKLESAISEYIRFWKSSVAHEADEKPWR